MFPVPHPDRQLIQSIGVMLEHRSFRKRKAGCSALLFFLGS